MPQGEPTPTVQQMAASQRKAITDAVAKVKTTVEAVTDTATAAVVKAAEDAIKAARDAIAAANHVPAAEKTAHTGLVNDWATRLTERKTSRDTAMAAIRDGQRDVLNKENQLVVDAIAKYNPHAAIQTRLPKDLREDGYSLKVERSQDNAETTIKFVNERPANDSGRRYLPKKTVTGSEFRTTVGEKIHAAAGGEPISFAGTWWDGAAGTFRCSPTASVACRSATAASGLINRLEGPWSFSNNSHIPMDATTSVDGWTAKRFSFENNKGRVFTNKGANWRRRINTTWAEFFNTAAGSTAPLSAATPVNSTGGPGGDPATGVYLNGALQFTTRRGNELDGEGYHRLASYIGLPKKFLPDVPDSGQVHGDGFSSSIRGTYLGVPGVFQLRDARAVRFKVHADGTFTADLAPGGIGVGFNFIPDFIAENIPLEEVQINWVSTIEDTNYITFGYWMTKTPADGDTKASQLIETFVRHHGYNSLMGHNSSGFPNDLVIEQLDGLANYNGPAAGIYTLRDGNINDLSIDYGEFNAKVSLTAHFNDGSAPTADRFSVSGTVSKFASTTDTTHDLSAWSLNLNKIANLNTGLNNLKGTTTGNAPANGQWSAQFVGNVDPTYDANNDCKKSDCNLLGQYR